MPGEEKKPKEAQQKQQQQTQAPSSSYQSLAGLIQAKGSSPLGRRSPLSRASSTATAAALFHRAATATTLTSPAPAAAAEPKSTTPMRRTQQPPLSAMYQVDGLARHIRLWADGTELFPDGSDHPQEATPQPHPPRLTEEEIAELARIRAARRHSRRTIQSWDDYQQQQDPASDAAATSSSSDARPS